MCLLHMHIDCVDSFSDARNSSSFLVRFVGLSFSSLRSLSFHSTKTRRVHPIQMIIFMYDEIRKYLMRTTSPEVMDKSTGQVKRIAGWLERNTYY